MRNLCNACGLQFNRRYKKPLLHAGARAIRHPRLPLSSSVRSSIQFHQHESEKRSPHRHHCHCSSSRIKMMTFWLRLQTSLFAVALALAPNTIKTPFGLYEMKHCTTCSTTDRLELAGGVNVAFASWWPASSDALQSPRHVESVVLVIAGGAQRLANVDDMMQRLFAAFASRWDGGAFVVVAPVLPLLSGVDELGVEVYLATFADNDAAPQILAAFCAAIARRFRAAGCHVVGLSNGGIAGIQLAVQRPAPVLSLTLLATGLLDERDLDAIRSSAKSLFCRIPVCMFVGTLDVPFLDASIDTMAAIEQLCGQTALRELNVLDDVHHWNIIEEVMAVSKSDHFRFL